ncbi:hypothetical protein [Peterkaempfera sp. SMS 1(5)a]|uniref:hypothetical protein n=1 Tax=Peterkaempfera podocarpi TaxID=3232308 RepID=UPI00366FA11F
MFRRWWSVRLVSGATPDRLPGQRRMTREQQETVLQEWQIMRSRLGAFAAERVAEAGDVLRIAELDLRPAAAGRDSVLGAVQRDYTWALEAYQAAGKLLDEAADLPDLAASVVLAERAVERLAAAHARHAGRRPKPAVARCFYNPLHGAAARPTAAGVPAKRKRARVSPRQAAADRRPACESCRLAILAGQRPDVLPALLAVRTSWRRTVRVLVPYYAVPQQRSPWSVTACGAYGDEGPALVMRGEHRRGGVAADH